jgi:hypothetical protein
MAIRLRKVLGGAQPPRPRDGAEAEGYRNGALSTQVPDEALQTAARSYRKFVAVLPPPSSRSGGLPGRRSSSQQTTGLHGTIAKVCKSGGEGTFAGTHGNGEVAPILDLPDPSPERGRSTRGRRSTYINQNRRTVRLDRGLLGTGASYVAPLLTGFTPGRDNRAESASRG